MAYISGVISGSPSRSSAFTQGVAVGVMSTVACSVIEAAGLRNNSEKPMVQYSKSLMLARTKSDAKKDRAFILREAWLSGAVASFNVLSQNGTALSLLNRMLSVGDLYMFSDAMNVFIPSAARLACTTDASEFEHIYKSFDGGSNDDQEWLVETAKSVALNGVIGGSRGVIGSSFLNLRRPDEYLVGIQAAPVIYLTASQSYENMRDVIEAEAPKGMTTEEHMLVAYAGYGFELGISKMEHADLDDLDDDAYNAEVNRRKTGFIAGVTDFYSVYNFMNSLGLFVRMNDDRTGVVWEAE